MMGSITPKKMPKAIQRRGASAEAGLRGGGPSGLLGFSPPAAVISTDVGSDCLSL